MILNLPQDAIIVDLFQELKIMQAPPNSEGIRRKRKLLTKGKESSLEFQMLTNVKEICEKLISQVISTGTLDF